MVLIPSPAGMMFPFIDYLAKYSGGYIHPGGQRATALLIAQLSLTPGERVLEYGFGCGHVLRDIDNLCRPQLDGVEISPTMLRQAQARLRGRHNIRLHLVGPMQKLPFPDNCFDKAYAESVLAILDTGQLHFTLGEIHRVLKPGGVFIGNEAIWKPETFPALRQDINRAILRDFMLIQSNAELAGVEDWTALFAAHGLELITAVPLAGVGGYPALPLPRKPLWQYLPDSGRMLCRYLLPVHYRYRRKLRSYHHVRRHIEAYLFGVRKPAQQE